MIRDYSRRFKLEMALNASIGGQKTKIYKVWEWLLENGKAKPVDIFRAFPELKQDYSTLKIGVEEGALIKNGRLYSANPDFKFRGIIGRNIRYNSVIAKNPGKEIKTDKPRNKSDIRKGEFYLDYEDEFEFENPIPHDDVIELGEYNWTKVGKINGHDLFLCNDIVRDMNFSKSDNDNNDWYNSDIRRWLNTSFYNKLSDDEKDNILRHPETGDNIFLLSADEAEEVNPSIRRLKEDYWWLRSPGYDEDFAAIVINNGYVDYGGYGVDDTTIGVRPALLLK